MQASAIKFSHETRDKLNYRPLSPAAKAKLRRERVKDYIRSKPAGTIIKQVDLAAAAGYEKGRGYGWGFINRMIKAGQITKDTSEGAQRPTWTVRGDERVVKPRKSITKQPTHTTITSPPPEPPLEESPDLVRVLSYLKAHGFRFTITIHDGDHNDHAA